MQVIRSFVREHADGVSWSVHAMLVAEPAAVGSIQERLEGIGADVERVDNLYTGLSVVTEDPSHYDLLVVECDHLGGIDEARRIVKLMGEAILSVPVLLVSSACQTQIFAQERHEPTVLRAPLSAVSMRVAFEHVMRDRLVPIFAA